MAKKLKIGVFGAFRGMTMINVLLKHPEAELVAICDKYVPALDKARAAAKEAGVDVAFYERFDDFFKHDMDAVVLANYATEHAPFAVRLLKSGRHVLSEVLPCETVAQGIELIEAVEESGKVYGYAENYCYMWHAFEMRRRYEAGEIGELMYAEGEYIHDCSAGWPGITYGERDHWRNNLHPNFYNTHSFGPIVTITGLRPAQVVGIDTRQDKTARPLGMRQGTCAGIEMVTMENGAIVKSVHGELKREPASVNYEVYGTKGSMESERFAATGREGKDPELQVYIEGDKLCQGTTEHYVPVNQVSAEMAKKFSSHGGSDFFPTHFFIEKILGNPVGDKYSIDVYTAVDMGLCGILGYRSALEGSKPYKIPNFRNKDEREPWRHDNKCTNPLVAKGDDLLPCHPDGNMEYPDSVYDEVRRIWLAGQNAE